MAKQAANKTSGSSPPDKWYADGLRFECTGCGNCCTGSPGYVWVNQAEIDAMAGELDITPAQFERKFVRNIGIRRSLKELPKSYDCVFLDANRHCTVYGSRPRQCRTWPFWDSNLKNEQAWQEMCEGCPGAGQGKLHQLEHIDQQAAIFHV